MELIGWISAVCLAICGAPQAWKCYRQGHSRGLSKQFIFLWFQGEVFGLIYCCSLKSIPLITNYLLNTLFLLVMIRYMFWERNEKERL